jgi:hypothetical protein
VTVVVVECTEASAAVTSNIWFIEEEGAQQWIYGEWDGDKGRSREKQTEIIHSDYIPCCLARKSGMKNFTFNF